MVVVAVVTSPFLADRKEECGEAEKRCVWGRCGNGYLGARDTRDGRVTRTRNMAIRGNRLVP